MQLTSTFQLPNAANIVTNSTTAGAANCVCTLPAAVGKFTYIEGFTVTGTGATAVSVVNAILSGIATNCTYAILSPANINAAITTLDVRFPTPIPSSAQNTAISMNVPNTGSGNTNICVSMYGFQA